MMLLIEGLLLFGAALVGLPLFVVMGLMAVSLSLFFDARLEVVLSMVEVTGQAELIALPLFTFAGFMMAESNTPYRLVRAANAVFGWMPGGLAIVALTAAAFFTAFTGASGVTIIALGSLLMPILLRQGYPADFSLGIVTTSGSLGLLFPPSLPIIIYGIAGETSIDELFVAGVLPGMVLLGCLASYSIFVAARSNVPRVKIDPREIAPALLGAAGELILVAVVFIGIYGGFFAPLEASAVTAVYVFVLECVVFRDISLVPSRSGVAGGRKLQSGEARKDLFHVMRESMVLIGGILVIVIVAKSLTGLLIDQDVPQKILATMRTLFHSRLTFLLALNAFLLVVGMLMDIFSAIVVVVPLIKPIAESFGVDPVHLGIVFLTNLEIGYLTPPVGINLFISSFVFKKPVLHLYKVAIPFILVLLGALAIITYVPSLSLAMLKRDPIDRSAEFAPVPKADEPPLAGGAATATPQAKPADDDYADILEEAGVKPTGGTPATATPSAEDARKKAEDDYLKDL
jgi:C4-dicarboxylate transporter, DctM subunit